MKHRSLYYLFIIAVLVCQLACVSLAQEKTFEQIKVERKPF